MANVSTFESEPVCYQCGYSGCPRVDAGRGDIEIIDCSGDTVDPYGLDPDVQRYRWIAETTRREEVTV